MNELFQIIGHIYDAALDDDQWGIVLQRTAQFLKCVNVSLGSFNLPQQSTNLTRLWGYKPEYLDSFRDRYRKFSPLVVRAGDAPVGVSVSVTDVMPYKQFQQTAFYREWTKPQGHVDALLVNLTKSKTATTFVLGGRHRRVGMVDQEMRKRMNFLSPHLRRAILIRDVINVPHVEAAALADTLDGALRSLVSGRCRCAHYTCKC